MSTGPQPNKPGVLMPAPTAWPFAMAVGSALVFTGLLTNAAVSVLGAIFVLMGAVGWFRQVLPHEDEELVPLQPEAAAELTRCVKPEFTSPFLYNERIFAQLRAGDRHPKGFGG